MTEFLPDLPALDVDRRLRAALRELASAERNAVLWFAEVLRRKLYRDLGYGSIHQYAELALGFGTAKTAQFIRLSESLRQLPGLRESLARGEVGWTKARTVAAVATPETETAWLQVAKVESRRKLEDRVRQARGRTRTLAKSARAPGQEALAMVPSRNEPAGTRVHEAQAEAAAPVQVSLRLTPEQLARYEALVELLRRRGFREKREELLLAGMESLAAETDPRPKASTTKRGMGAEGPESEATRPLAPPPYQVHVRLCPSCAGGSVVTGRGPRLLHPKELRSILCDARIRKPGERNRAVIPPGVRRAVLERDGFRCRAAGCGRGHFLAVHHLEPREAGGSNDAENLITLCGACHRALHATDGPAIPRKKASPVGETPTRVPG